MKPLFGKALMGIAALAMLSAVGCNRAAPNVAVINGEAITQDEFDSYLKVKPEVRIITQDGTAANGVVAQTLGFQALEDLVRQRIILQLARDMKVEPTDADVVAEVEFQRKRNPNFVKTLMERGLTMDQIRKSLKVDLAREKILTRGIVKTDAEVDKFIKDNPGLFTEPATADALWIFVKDDRGKREAERALTAGSSFSTVAVRLSQAPGAAQNNGRFPQRVIAAIPSKEVQDLMTNTPEGKETDWVKLQDGWAKFYIEERTAAKKIEITDTVKQWYKRQLAMQEGINASDLDKRLRDKLLNAKIEVVTRDLKSPWEAAMEQLKTASDEANAAPTSPTKSAEPGSDNKPATNP